MGAEHQHPPLGGQVPEGRAEHSIQVLGLLLFQQPLAVGRVGHQLAVFAVPVEFSRVCHFKTDAVLHTGQLRVVPRQLHSGGVNIAAPDVIMAVEFLIHGLVTGLQPQLGVHVFPLLSGKAAVQARRPVLGDKGCLDGDGAAAAEGVAEGILSPVTGEGHQRCRQRFPQGRTHVFSPVAPLVKALARGVQIQGRYILDDGKLDLIPAAGFRQGLHAVLLPQPLSGRLFHDGLTGGDRVELRVQGIALYREFAVPGDIVLPGQGVDPLKQRLEITGREGAKLHQHPCAAAEVDVQPGNVSQSPFTVDPAVFRLDIF